MAERTDEDLKRLQNDLRSLVKQKELIDADIRVVNRKIAAIHNNRLLIT